MATPPHKRHSASVITLIVKCYSSPYYKYSQYLYVCCRAYDHEEDDSDHDERLVGNPIYSGSLPTARENRISERESYDVLHRTTGVNLTGAYEVISNLPIQPNKDIQALQTKFNDASVVYAKLGAEGVSDNADENVRVGVKENELRSPYANISEISPTD